MYINEADNRLYDVNTVRISDFAFNKGIRPVFQEVLRITGNNIVNF